MATDNQIVIFDTTLRDGEQSPGCTMHHAEKLRMAHQLASLGVDIIEAGFAIASDGDSASSFAITWLTAGCVRCKRAAARLKLLSSATARNVSN